MFADRFTQVMGSPAMHYLSNWRLQLAASLLEEQRLSIAQVAAHVGYESEAAFNRAFKKLVGAASRRMATLAGAGWRVINSQRFSRLSCSNLPWRVACGASGLRRAVRPVAIFCVRPANCDIASVSMRFAALR